MKEKPSKPYPDFPLFPHDNGQWCKTIRRKHYFFGVWRDPQAALKKYLRDKDALNAGIDPKTFTGNELTLQDGCEAFLVAKNTLVDTGEIKQRTFDEYERTVAFLVKALGKTTPIASLTPVHFDGLKTILAKRLGIVGLGNEIMRIRMIFRYLAHDDVALIDKAPRFGPHFRKPTAKALRIARKQSGDKLFEPDEINTLISRATVRLKAMIYLGINCGFGNGDIGHLTNEHLDLYGGWVDYPRPKTGIDRRAKLWPETVKAIRALPRVEANKKEHDDLVFLTRNGNPWADDGRLTTIAVSFALLLNNCNLRRKGLSFYALRHTFQTIGEKSRDIPAVRSIMGHAPPPNDMSSIYRERIDDERLIHVSNYVRSWLKGGAKSRRQVS